MYDKILGLTLNKSVFDTIYHGGNYGQTSGEDGWTDYRQAFAVLGNIFDPQMTKFAY